MRDEAFVWFPGGEASYLLGCWLRAQATGTSVVLLAPPSAREAADAVVSAHPSIAVEVASLAPGGALPEGLAGRIAARECPLVVVPEAMDQAPMRYQPALMADLPPHYATLRQLWRWGFREVQFAGLRGGHTFPIPHMPEAFHNIHLGRRCFVVGNGPSLNDIDMSLLKEEITLGSNRCFLGYETWRFPFTYWGVYDKFQIEMYHAVYEAGVPAETVKFFPVEYLPAMHVANGCPVNSVWPAGGRRAFSAEPGETYVGFTVTYMLLQLAACMGCDPIILIGADHSYELNRRGYVRALRQARRAITHRLRGGRVYDTALAAHRAWRKHGGGGGGATTLWSTENASGATHFTDRYTAGGKNRFLPPEPEEAERDFDCAQAWAEANGRRILNATPGTALESFPKVDFRSLF